MTERDQLQGGNIDQGLVSPAEMSVDQATLFPGEIEAPVYQTGMGFVLRGLSLEGEEKEFVFTDYDSFLYNTPESLHFDMSNQDGYDTAAFLIAHLKLDTGIDIRIGQAIDEEKSLEANTTVFREDNLAGMYIDKKVAILAPMVFIMSSPHFGSGGELPISDDEWKKKFSDYFEKAQEMLPPYPDISLPQD